MIGYNRKKQDNYTIAAAIIIIYILYNCSK